MVGVNGTLYFAADDGLHGSELWMSDGTPAGTVLVADISAVGNSIQAADGFQRTLFFAATDGIHGRELWRLGDSARPCRIYRHGDRRTDSRLGVWHNRYGDLVLTALPNSNVIIDVTSGDAGEASVNPTQLTFTAPTGMRRRL